MTYIVIKTINIFFKVIIYAIIAQVFLSYFRFNSSQASKIYDVIDTVTSPIMTPVRNFTHKYIPTGPFDFSPIIAIVLLNVVQSILIRVVLGLLY